MFLRSAFIILLGIFKLGDLLAQISVTPLVNPCVCTGQMSFTSPVVAPATFEIYDHTGSLLASSPSPDGTFSVSGLCGEPYSLVMLQSGQSTHYVFNVPSVATDPGDAASSSICSTYGNVNLNTLIPGFMAGGTWADPSGLVISNVINSQLLTDGWYTYSVNAGACNLTTGVLIDLIQNADPGGYQLFLFCEDHAPFLMIDQLTGTPDPNGVWLNSSGVEVNGVFDPATMNSETFTYMIDTVQGCPPVFAVLQAQENLIPDPGQDSSLLVCQNGVPFNMTAYLGGDPDIGGNWFGPLNQPVSTTFNPSTFAAGIYTYKLNGLTPCSDQESHLTISYIAQNPAGQNGAYSVCENGGNVNMLSVLAGAPLAGGTWTNALGMTVDNVFSPATEPAGNYTYYYPSVGCNSTTSVLNIALENIPDAGADNSTTLCETVPSINLSSLLIGADAGGTWADAGGLAISPAYSIGINSGTIHLTYHVNGTACPDDNANINITIDPQVSSPGNTSLELCGVSAPVDLNSLYPAYPSLAYENTAGSAVAAMFDPSSNVSTVITAINPSGNSCPDATSQIDITVQQPLFSNDSVHVNLCQSQLTYDLNSAAPSAATTPGYWLNGSLAEIPDLLDLDFTGTRSFQFLADTVTACGTNVFNLEVESFSFEEAGEDESAIFCNSDDAVSLTDLLTSSTSGSGSWLLNGLPFISSVIDPAVNVTGLYQYVIPANGPCPADIAELDVTIQQGLLFSAGEDMAQCTGTGAVQLGEPSQPGTSYIWSPSQNLSSTSIAQPTVTFLNDGAFPLEIDYAVLVNDGTCTARDTVSIVTYPLPSPGLENDYAACAGETVHLQVPPGSTYQWTPAYLFDDPGSSFHDLDLFADASIHVEVTNTWGCEATDTTHITIHEVPTLFFEPEGIASCSPLAVQYSIDAASSNVDHLVWEIPGVNVFYMDTLVAILTQPGHYDLDVTAVSAFGCETSLHFNNLMEVYSLPVAAFESDPAYLTTLDPGATFINASIDAISYDWDFAGLGTSTEESPSFEFPNSVPGSFDVCLTVTNELGCVDSSCHILYLNNEYVIYAPNAFTPDDDGINDVFKPVLLGFDESTYSLEIFDRWGDAIFRTSDIQQPWTGNVLNGEYYAQQDVYTWQVKVKDMDNAEFRLFKGHITLLR